MRLHPAVGKPVDVAGGSGVKPMGLGRGQEAVSCPTALPAPSPPHAVAVAAPSPTLDS